MRGVFPCYMNLHKIRGEHHKKAGRDKKLYRPPETHCDICFATRPFLAATNNSISCDPGDVVLHFLYSK